MTEKIFDTSGQFIIKNAVFDVIMPNLSPNAFKVLCVAIRQTWGWVAEPGGNPNNRREWDRISYTQFMEKAGIGSKSTVSRAVAECLEAGYLKRHESGRANTGQPIYAYSLNTDYELADGTETVPSKPHSTETVPTHSTETVPTHSTETVLTNTNENKETNGVGGHTNKTSQSVKLLKDFGVASTVAKLLASERALEDIQGWIDYAECANGLTNPPAFVVARLRDGEEPPETEYDSNDPRRYITGKYADLIQT